MSVELIPNFERTTLEYGQFVRLMYSTPPTRDGLTAVAIGVSRHIANSPYFDLKGQTLDPQRQRLAVDLMVTAVPQRPGDDNLQIMMSNIITVSTKLGFFGVKKAEFVSKSELNDTSRLRSMGVGDVSIFVPERSNVTADDFLTGFDRVVLNVGDGLGVITSKVVDAGIAVKGFLTSPLFLLSILAFGLLIALILPKGLKLAGEILGLAKGR